MDVLSGRKNRKLFTVNLLNIFQRKWGYEKGKDNELCNKCKFSEISKLRRLGVCSDSSFYEQNLPQGTKNFQKHVIPLMDMFRKGYFLGFRV